LFNVLGINQDIASQMIRVYCNTLEPKIKGIIQKMNAKTEKNPAYDSDNPQTMIFLDAFVDCLSKLTVIFDGLNDDMQSQYKTEGLLQIIKETLDYVTKIGINDVVSGLTDYYSLQQMSILPKEPAGNLLKRIHHYCEEISEMSNEYHQLLQHLCRQLKELSHGRDATKEFNEMATINALQNQTALSKIFSNQYNKFIELHQYYLMAQIKLILKNSAPYNAIFNSDKAFFLNEPIAMQDSTKEEAINSKYYEYLDELFFMTKNCVTKSLVTLDKSVICSFLQFVTNNVVQEEIHNICDSLVMRYLKKENVTQGSIYFSSTNTLANSLIIVLLNAVSLCRKYISNLKTQLNDELADYALQESDKKTVHVLIDQIEENNVSVYHDLLQARMNELAEYLRPCVILSLSSTFDTLP
jgi:hypothetical protein